MIKSKSEFKLLLVYPNLPLMLVPSLAIGLFTAIAKKQGYQVELFETTGYLDDSDVDNISPENRIKFSQSRPFSYEKDLGVQPRLASELYGDFRAKVLEFKPDLLFFSVVEDAFWQALKLLESIKELEVPHILGGVFPTAAPDVCLSYEAITTVGLGEGEKILVELSEAIRTKGSLAEVPGIAYKNENGEFVKNAKPALVNINDVEPDYSLFDSVRFMRPMGGRIFKTIPVETYRGCPYSCTYCNSPMHLQFAKTDELGNFLRRKTIPKLRDELKNVVDNYQPEFIYFVDDSFLARPKREIFEFCEMYSEFKLPFWFNTRPENCTPEIMEALREAGVYRISFGIECGNEQYRKEILLRGVSNQKLIDHFEVIANSGVDFSVNLIIGFPGETRELVFDTVQLVKMINGYDALTVSVFTPYHGTRLRQVAINNSWLDESSITKHTTSKSILKMDPPYLNSDEIYGLMLTLPLYCFFDESHWQDLERAEIDDVPGESLLRHYSERYQKEFLGDTQDRLEIISKGGTGCKVNPRDDSFVSLQRLTSKEIQKLDPLATAQHI